MRIPEPNSPAEMAALTPEQKDMLINGRNADLAKTALIDSLINLGELDDAVALGSAEAAEIKEAIEKPDDERCDCVYTIPTHSFGANGEPKWTDEERQAKNYLTSRRVWSDKHGSMVNVYRCFLCGHTNATPEPLDDVHAAIDKARAAFPDDGKGMDMSVLQKPD